MGVDVGTDAVTVKLVAGGEVILHWGTFLTVQGVLSIS